MKFDQVEYQRQAYDRHYPKMEAALRKQLAHPLLSSFYDRLAERILDMGLGDGTGKRSSSSPVRLFEAGCGEGLLGSAVQRTAARRGLDFAYTGADLSGAGLELARTVLAGDLLKGDACELVADLPPGSQDLLWAKNLIHHLEDPATFLRSALDAVGPQGRVVIIEPRMWCPMHWINLVFVRQERYQFLGYRRTLSAFDKAGATLLRAEAFGWLPYELALATRLDAPRKLFSSGDPRFIDKVSRFDDRLTATLPNLALYGVSLLAAEGSSDRQPASGLHGASR